MNLDGDQIISDRACIDSGNQIQRIAQSEDDSADRRADKIFAVFIRTGMPADFHAGNHLFIAGDADADHFMPRLLQQSALYTADGDPACGEWILSSACT